jgi:RHS repeat-associated protein
VYTPYGESQTLTASWTTPAVGSSPAIPWAHLFQGLKFTDVTGLAYVRHRDYSPTLGRFIEMDQLGFEAGDNNWYRFVANGPAGKTDPSGLWTMDHRPYVVDDGGAAAGNGCPDAQGKRTNPTLDSIQLGLDLLGLVPVFGEAFDGLNGLISLGRGDLTGAGLSFAGMVPVGGQAATAGKLTLKYGDEVVAAAGRCAAPNRTVIGKIKDLDNLAPGENTLLKHLPDQGTYRANWRQNSSVLRQEIRKGNPIRDASLNPDGTLKNYPGSFLEAERNLLRNHGWTFDPSTGLWSPAK